MQTSIIGQVIMAMSSVAIFLRRPRTNHDNVCPCVPLVWPRNSTGQEEGESSNTEAFYAIGWICVHQWLSGNQKGGGRRVKRCMKAWILNGSKCFRLDSCCLMFEDVLLLSRLLQQKCRCSIPDSGLCCILYMTLGCKDQAHVSPICIDVDC